jgi:hypothetical protein
MTDEADEKAARLKRFKGIAVALILVPVFLVVGSRVVGWVPTVVMIVSLGLGVVKARRMKAERAEFLRPRLDFPEK